MLHVLAVVLPVDDADNDVTDDGDHVMHWRRAENDVHNYATASDAVAC